MPACRALSICLASRTPPVLPHMHIRMRSCTPKHGTLHNDEAWVGKLYLLAASTLKSW